MKKIEVNTIQEATRLLPKFGVLIVSLLLYNGESVEVYDEVNDTTYIFNSKREREVGQ